MKHRYRIQISMLNSKALLDTFINTRYYGRALELQHTLTEESGINLKPHRIGHSHKFI